MNLIENDIEKKIISYIVKALIDMFIDRSNSLVFKKRQLINSGKKMV